MAVSSDIKLSVYNGALRRLGSRRIASLTEAREPRRVLDDIWNNGQVVYEALEKGDWNFALRAAQLDYLPSIETGFGFPYAFSKPDDFRRLSALSADEYFRTPLTTLEYGEDGGYWLSNLTTLFVRYVSDDTDYGMNSAGWSASFQTYLECKMAFEACERLTGNRGKKADLAEEMRQELRQAKSHDAMADAIKMRPMGSWVRARRIGRRTEDIGGSFE